MEADGSFGSDAENLAPTGYMPHKRGRAGLRRRSARAHKTRRTHEAPPHRHPRHPNRARAGTLPATTEQDARARKRLVHGRPPRAWKGAAAPASLRAAPWRTRAAAAAAGNVAVHKRTAVGACVHHA